MPEEREITNEQKMRVLLAPKTESGHPAAVDGTPEWSILTGDSVVVEAAADGMSAFIISSDEILGDSLVNVRADADLGTGVVTIQDTVLVHVRGAMAANVGLTIETPIPK